MLVLLLALSVSTGMAASVKVPPGYELCTKQHGKVMQYQMWNGSAPNNQVGYVLQLASMLQCPDCMSSESNLDYHPRMNE